MSRLFDGVDDVISSTIIAIAGGDVTIGAWIRPNSSGEGTNGIIIQQGNGLAVAYNATLDRSIRAVQTHATTDATSPTTTLLTNGIWQVVFATYTAADSKCRVYIGGLDTPVFEASYASQIAGVGARSAGAVTMLVGNNAAGSRTFDGRIRAPFNDNRLWTLSEMEAFRLGAMSVNRNRGLEIPGVATANASSPDSVPLSFGGDCDFRVFVEMDDVTPAAQIDFVAKYESTGNQRSFRFGMDTATKPLLVLSNDGTTVVQTAASAAASVIDGQRKMLRATWRDSDNRLQFFQSDAWDSGTQLGTDRSLVSAGIFNSTTALTIGSLANGSTGIWAGKVIRVQIRNNVLDDGTGIVFDTGDMSKHSPGKYTSPGVRTFVEESSNGALVTLNAYAAIGPLRAFLPLDSPTASQAEDLSGYGANGTVTGCTVAEDPPVPFLISA